MEIKKETKFEVYLDNKLMIEGTEENIKFLGNFNMAILPGIVMGDKSTIKRIEPATIVFNYKSNF